ncbi:MAG: DNA-protecting protein DprA [bacterium]|nr:DNA-protecting protein DprA [bacterium]
MGIKSAGRQDAQISLTQSEKIARLRLARTYRVGPLTYHAIMQRFPSAEDALEALPELGQRSGKTILPYEKHRAEQEWEMLHKLKGRFLFKGEKEYPKSLGHLYDAPPVISVLGPLSLNHEKVVAIVGARNASANGCRLTHRWAQELGEQGYIVTSGLARGIDTAAHRGALITGTVAVLAGGLDRIYPPENKDLYRQISEIGCIISESPLGVKPQANLFPKRNRIVSGLSLGVVVVEAAVRSGSLITAQCALEQGREVMAIPGSPEDPRSHGTNHLLKQGATLVYNVQSITDTPHFRSLALST